MSPPTTIFIGDVHGCAEELDELLERLAYDPHRDRLLLTGDAFSRGPAPLRVWERIRDTGAEMVLGNHDARLLLQISAHRDGREIRFKKDQRRCFEALEPAFDELLPWLDAMPLYIDDPTFLLVHAGIHPEAGLAGTSRQECITIRIWPPTDGIEGPRWHDVIEPLDTRPIVFGHDAPGGLVVKRREGADGRPWLVGLDSGCVYGGQLSAWRLGDSRVVQVDSRQEDAFGGGDQS